jgi:transposase
MVATARHTIPHVPVRYRCRSCGNLTRFDVVATRRTSAFHHYSVGGDLTVEEEELLEERVERVTCRWCDATGDSIEELAVDEAAAPAEPA